MIRVAILSLSVILSATFVRADAGLLARYDDGKHKIEAVAPQVAFSLGANESIDPQIGPNFKAEYEGSIKVLRRGAYTFSAPGATLTIDGKPVAGAVELEGGEHEIELRYTRPAGAARLQLTWGSAEFLPEPVPASVLSHKGEKGLEQQALVEEGRTLVEELNCAGCHSAQHLSSFVGPDLSDVGNRVKPLWIYLWLQDPSKHGPVVSMPAILEKEEDCRDVASYLATLKDSRRRVNDYKASASKARQGKELFETIGCANCHGDQLAGQLGAKWRSIGQLAEYLKDPVRVTRSGRMPSMNLNDDEAVSLANYLLSSSAVAIEGAFPKNADAKHGEQVFRSAGCLNCHSVGGSAGKPLAEARKFTAMERLDPSKGCLAESVPAGAARYALSAEKRGAIGAFLSAIKSSPLVSAAPGHEFARTLHKLNCVACHETDDSKPAEDIEKVPPLTEVGVKLKKDWINRVLHDRNARVRFWLKTRMPEFGGAVDHVAEEAVAAAGIDESEEPVVERPNPAKIKLGQKLVGANDPKKNPMGMGCVTCHSLREFKPAVAADATRGPELTLMTTRLRSDFFHRWMHEPARIQPGTAMPNFFTDKSREEADRTIETLWAYASLGQSMPAPVGVKEKKNYVLIVTDTPVMARAQIPDPAGLIVYGISVGLPEGVNYTFDARGVMLRTAWRGGFMDMSGDWDGRGGNPVRILGKRFYSQAVAPLRVGEADKDSPRVFKGYELKEKIPTFIYTVGGVEVRERITAMENGEGIVRTFEYEAGDKPVYFVVSDVPGVTLTLPKEAVPVPKLATGSGQVLQIAGKGKVTFSVVVKAK
jgi:mono/diheme cytochrome c family protein